MTTHELAAILLAGEDLPVGACFTGISSYINEIVDVKVAAFGEEGEATRVIVLDMDEGTMNADESTTNIEDLPLG